LTVWRQGLGRRLLPFGVDRNMIVGRLSFLSVLLGALCFFFAVYWTCGCRRGACLLVWGPPRCGGGAAASAQIGVIACNGSGGGT